MVFYDTTNLHTKEIVEIVGQNLNDNTKLSKEAKAELCDFLKILLGQNYFDSIMYAYTETKLNYEILPITNLT